MVKSIAELRREIAEQRRIVAKEQKTFNRTSKIITERQKLSRQLFELKNRKLIAAGERTKKGFIRTGAKAKRLSKRFGKALLKVGRKAAPVIQKQARLIREQQLRDDAIFRARAKRKPKTRKKSKKRKLEGQDNLGVFANLDF